MSEATDPPSPDGVPLLGHGYAFSRDPFGALERWAEHGDVVRVEFPGQTLYLATHPSVVEEVLHDGRDRFTIADRQREAFAGVEDHALTTSTGDRWKRLRTALHPAFTRDAIERYGERMVALTEERVDSWEEGEEIDLHHEMRLLTIRIVADTLLDVDVRGDESVVVEATDALIDRSDPRRVGQLLPDWVPTPTDRRFERSVGRLDDYADRCLSEERDAEGARSALLAAHERGDLTREETRHNLVALLLAGSDTSALALTYCWYLLSDHPEVRESLVAEYEEHVAPGRLGVEARDDLEGVQNVLAEALRLYPPTWSFMRQARESVTLGDYRLPAGAQVMISQWVLHRDGRFWDDPGTFDPSRWRGDADHPEYAYFPFGGGPRHCIGMHFARLELHLALATMVDRVDLDVSVDGDLSFQPALSLRPGTDLTATVHHR